MMQYRPFGKLDFQVSALGFGAMRLPVKEGQIDETEATAMLHYAIDHGVNYVDTAYPYHGGASEPFVGRALRGGYRERVKLATKLPSWMIQSAADFDKYLNEQLQRLQDQTIDFYLLHSLDRDSWPKLRDLGVRQWAKRAIADGRIRYLGFSFHDDPEAFQPIVDDYDWTFCQIQYNYMDVANQAGLKGLQYAAAKGLAVVIMEPLLGGKLVAPPQSVQAIWDRAAQRRTPVEWALQWIWSHPEVAVVLSGMSTMDQVKENVALADRAAVHSLSPEELALVDEVRARYQGITAIPCTNCKYCMPCPQNVDIPANFANYNDGIAYAKPEASRGQYGWWKVAHEVHGIMEHDIRAVRCVQCGACETKCPQKIPISQWMPVLHSVLDEGKPFVMNL
ncbi:hypothetical protein EDC14_101484 [Hydrogenispora ethanolica]|uniref:4Fe-4S ferredoxin-type domain-containing protein n=2 Tax=Hydrogenispora ethanolica TaxID=1082276 RepID=A0A4R1RMA4_HYDET|nr:hypothetical protein EDC14_101484 [Hydrogenispora ethanolica]